MKINRRIKRLLQISMVCFLLAQVVAWMHAYKFTHFDTVGMEKTKNAQHLSITQKMTALLLGVSNPRPVNEILPDQPFETVRIESNESIECWYLPVTNAKGTVIIFHGYSGKKSSMLDKSDLFHALGFNTLLVDFMGSGGSAGNQTSIGYHESRQVADAFRYIQQRTGGNIYLFGTSMGAVAVMKALHENPLPVSGIILECPFGSMRQTVQARFIEMGVPSFPMADFLILWGGVQNGFNAFRHNPVEYAKQIDSPTLLLYGAKDKTVSRKEIDEIFLNLAGPKKLKIYPEAGHENYLTKYSKEWTEDVSAFLTEKLEENERKLF